MNFERGFRPKYKPDPVTERPIKEFDMEKHKQKIQQEQGYTGPISKLSDKEREAGLTQEKLEEILQKIVDRTP